MALGEEGYRTLAAPDGIQALALVEQEQPALVLMDIGMPLLSGRDLAARIHELCGAQVPCIVMSGGAAAGGGQIDGTIVAGYLSKPFGLDELLDLVRTLVADAVS
jgi:CheY-like chemotaxis protein